MGVKLDVLYMFYQVLNVRYLMPFIMLLLAFNTAVADVRGSQDYPTIERFPRSTIVQFNEVNNLDYRLVLGGLEKVNGVIIPEDEQRLAGELVQLTYRIPSNHSPEEAYSHLSTQLLNSGAAELFSCQGRACGSSNQWANSIFKYSRLYGVDNSQWYGAFQSEGQYYILYAVQRGNKRVYLRLEVLETGTKKQSEDIAQPLEVEFDNSAQQFQQIVTFLHNNPSKKVWLVASSNREGSYQQKIDKGSQLAGRLKERLVAEGIEQRQIEIHSLGGFTKDLNTTESKLQIYTEDL